MSEYAIPRRPYGATGLELSIVGFGGIVVNGNAQSRANEIVADAVARSVNYFDVAPTYDNAQAILGPALEPFRKEVFLACKTMERNRDPAAAELSESLKLLRTDYFDLYQIHCLASLEDVDMCFGKGGAMEVLIEAHRAGQIRYLGFSAHSSEAALIAMDRYDFDSVLFPVNYTTFTKGKFGPQILAKAQAKGMARMALKALAQGPWSANDPLRDQWSKCWYKPIMDKHLAELSFRFTLSQSVTAAISPGDERPLNWMLEFAERYKPLNAEELIELEYLTKQDAPLFEAAG